MRGLIISLLIVLAPAVGAAEVTVADLVADPNAYGEVTVTGELIGDYGHREGSVWTQLNGDAYATAPLLAGGDRVGSNVGIGVRIPTEVFDLAGSNTPGGYRHRGPLVELTGTWRHHDPDRGGESYLDVSALVLIEADRPLGEGLRPLPFIAGIVFAGAGLAVWLTDRRRLRFR